MKVALISFGMESSTFSPLKPTRHDLNVKVTQFSHPDLIELFANAGIELVPVMMASGQPSGMLQKDSYESLCNEILDCCDQLGPFAGALISMHGSMLVDDGRHGELEFLKRFRTRFGDDLPVSVRLDLHGNIPDEFVGYASVITALRTAPHRDVLETIMRAGRLLIRIINERCRPVSVLVRVPLLFPGEWVMTDSEPGRSLYARLDQIEAALPEILSASIMVGFAWADVSYAGASVIVSALTREVAQREAAALAEIFWKLRSQFGIKGEHYPAPEAITQAMASDTSPVFISDSGDNITAGASGQSTDLLRMLCDRGAKDVVFAQLFDPHAYELCRTIGVGNQGSIELGRTSDAASKDVLNVSGVVESHAEFEHGNAVLFVFNAIRVVITSRRFPVAMKEQFEKLGVDLMKTRIAVFKVGYLLPPLADYNVRGIIALTHGPTTLDITSLHYTKVRRPIFPLDAMSIDEALQRE